MIIVERIMVGKYTNGIIGIQEIMNSDGIAGFYKAWKASIIQKVPSYSLNWALIEQFKLVSICMLHSKRQYL